jgi:aryl-alcohol dehydrogenase-like predicted oxidoreductase
MNYRLLGPCGLRVSEIALGTMTFGEEWGWGASREESRRIFDAFAAAGGNFIDTANRYTEGTSERLVGEFVAAERERFVVATKYTLFNRKGDPNAAGNHRKNLVQSLEASLERLKTDYVDLLWVHAWDHLTPVEEVMRGLDDVVRAGKALYVGVSDTPAWIVARANMLAELRAWTPFAGIQIEYSLIQRTVERELLPMARGLGLAVTAWGVIGGGMLTGKYNPDAPAEQKAGPGRMRNTPATPRLAERNLHIAALVREVAKEAGRTPAQVAVNWVRHQPGIVIPIVGARSQRQLDDVLGALEFELSPEQRSRLDEASRIELGFPHEFTAAQNIRDLIYGGTFERILDRRP